MQQLGKWPRGVVLLERLNTVLMESVQCLSKVIAVQGWIVHAFSVLDSSWSS